MLGGRRTRRWREGAAPYVLALHAALVELIADIGEPGPVVLTACDELDRRIADADRWLLGSPAPDPADGDCVVALIGACAGLWATTVHIARLTPAGIDAGVGHLPSSCTLQMSERVDALELSLEAAIRRGLL